MSALDPPGASQPTQQQAYETPGNPASKTPTEKSHAAQNDSASSDPVDQRIPQKQASEDQATPSALGRGVRGAGEGEEARGSTEEDVGRHNELDGEQMAAPGEGKVADAVAGRGIKGSGVGGELDDLAADLDRKKDEQAEAREAMKKQRAQGTAEGGALGQQGGPANG